MALPVAVYSRLRQLRRQAGKEGKFSGEKPSISLYLGVGAIALFKDLLDLPIGFLAGVVTVISFCITFLIWMLLFLFDRSGGGANKQMVRGLILTGVALFEGVGIGFNYLPVETLSVALLYVLAQRAYRRASKAGAAAEAKQTKAERVAEQQLRYQAQAAVEEQFAARAEEESQDRSEKPTQSAPTLKDFRSEAVAATPAMQESAGGTAPRVTPQAFDGARAQSVAKKETAGADAQMGQAGQAAGPTTPPATMSLAPPESTGAVASRVPLTQTYGARNEGYQFSKDYSQKWRWETTEKMKKARSEGKSREEQQEILKRFYRGQKETAETFQKDLQSGKRDVKDLALNHNALFLHGVPILKGMESGTMSEPGRNTSANNPLFDSTKMGHLDRVGGIASVRPTISVFTRRIGVKEPSNSEEAFYPVGVVLGGGTVLSAYGGDAGTITRGLREKYSKYDKTLNSSVQLNTETNMEQALQRKINTNAAFGGTNEIIVEKPEIKGAYAYVYPSMKDDELFRTANPHGHDEYLKGMVDYTMENVKGALEVSKKYGVPAYLVTHNGQILDLLDESFSPTSMEKVMAGKSNISARTKLEDAQKLLSHATDEKVKKEIEHEIEEIQKADRSYTTENRMEKVDPKEVDALLALADPEMERLERGIGFTIGDHRDKLTSKESLFKVLRDAGVNEKAMKRVGTLFESQNTAEDCITLLRDKHQKRMNLKERLKSIVRENEEPTDDFIPH